MLNSYQSITSYTVLNSDQCIPFLYRAQLWPVYSFLYRYQLWLVYSRLYRYQLCCLYRAQLLQFIPFYIVISVSLGDRCATPTDVRVGVSVAASECLKRLFFLTRVRSAPRWVRVQGKEMVLDWRLKQWCVSSALAYRLNKVCHSNLGDTSIVLAYPVIYSYIPAHFWLHISPKCSPFLSYLSLAARYRGRRNESPVHWKPTDIKHCLW